MAENLARQLIAEHLIEGEMRPDAEIALKIDSHESPRFAPTMLLTHQVEREWRISMAILT